MADAPTLSAEAAKNLKENLLPQLGLGKYSLQELLDKGNFQDGSDELQFLTSLSPIGRRTRQQIEELIDIHSGTGATVKRSV